MIILTPNAKYKFFGRDDSNENCDELVVKETWVENVYQINEGDFYDTGIFIDIGANIGAVSLYALSLNDQRNLEEHKPIRVIAYEPERDNLVYFSKNIRHNLSLEAGTASDPNVIRVHSKAVEGYQGTGRIVARQGNSRLTDDAGTEVPVIKLDDVFRENGISECDVMKVDIEGSEYPMFAAADEATLKRIKYLTMEFDKTDGPTFGELVYKLSRVFNLHIIGSPERGGYIYGRRY